MDKATLAILEKAEAVLKDRFSHYLIVCLDGDKSYSSWTSDTVAVGMCHQTLDELAESKRFANDDED